MPRKANPRILLTGATGQIGSELALELRKRHGNKNVVAAGHRRRPSRDLLDSGPFVYVDATKKDEVEEIVREFEVDTIYHLAAVLSAVGEERPQLAWELNMHSLYNVLEIARERTPLRVFWPSSIAVFGPEAPRIDTPQETVLIPRTMYGVTKVAGELLCNYYFSRFSVDVRSVRYPGIISSETLPGGGTTDYAVEIFYEAIKKKKYTCFVREDTILPMMYMPDCIKAAADLMEADPAKVRCRTSYNLTAMSFCAGELAAEIRKYVPEFECRYEPDFRQEIADSWPSSIDDAAAREDWGWRPNYGIQSMTKDMIQKLLARYENDDL